MARAISDKATIINKETIIKDLRQRDLILLSSSRILLAINLPYLRTYLKNKSHPQRSKLCRGS